jgi:multidrug efflux system membrane fusion protein
MIPRLSLLIGTLVAILVVPLLVGCDAKEAQATVAAPTGVSVSQPGREQVADSVEFTGTIKALNTLDLRARVKGFLKKINYTQGATVKAGDLLFEIDPDVFQAELDSAKATLQAAKASQEKSDADYKIKQEMAAGNAASKLDVIQAKAALDVSSANVLLCEAKVKEAEIQLGYTKIYTNITGRIDKSRVDAGNLVGSDGNTLLATVVQADKVYVEFQVDEATAQRFHERMREQKDGDVINKPKATLTLALGDTDDFSHKGSVFYIDNKVDTATGTVKVQGILDNPDYALIPGYFARVRIPDGQPYQAVLVPDRAIGIDQGQKYVLTVNDKNVVEMKPIETGAQHGRMRVVKKGLNGDEWVITEGLLRTRPGATVAPEKKPLQAADTKAAPTTAPTTAPQA